MVQQVRRENKFSDKDKYELARLYFAMDANTSEDVGKQLEAAIRLKFKFGFRRSLEEPQIRKRLEVTVKNGPPAKRFLDVLGWIVLGIGGMALLAFLVQFLIFNVFPYAQLFAEYERLMAEHGAERTFFDILPIIWTYGGIQAGIQLLVGFGIIKRLSWAKTGMLIVLIAAAIWAIGSPFLFFTLDFFPDVGDEGLQTFGLAVKIIMFAVLFFNALLYIALYSWVFYKMTRPEIREEFAHPWEWDGTY